VEGRIARKFGLRPHVAADDLLDRAIDPAQPRIIRSSGLRRFC
jgi:hypothetical protein